jgi:hypothetical protein
MFFVWFDGDRKRRPHLKLRDAVAGYREKQGADPRICLVSEADAAAIVDSPGHFDMPVRAMPFVAVNTFYLGGPDAVAALAELELPAAELRQAA